MKHTFLYFKIILFTVAIMLSSTIGAQHKPQFSTAGFFELENTGRQVFSMNMGWRFYKGALQNAQDQNYDDSSWESVAIPHGLELVPEEASGCLNYQGEAWYRKHFVLDDKFVGKKLFLHFEGIMGKSKVWINGKLVKEYFGGFLPIVIDVTNELKPNAKNLIAVWTDNSDDGEYPPGKPQHSLDFSYFGGIYRDTWLVAQNETYITDPNFVDDVAGGGLFVHYPNVSKELADIGLKLHLQNDQAKNFSGKVEFLLKDKQGIVVAKANSNIAIANGNNTYTETKLVLKKPHLWSPDSPYLYNLEVRVKDNKGVTVDGFRQRLGIKKIEVKGTDGLWLNGEPYQDKIIGANRHQDFGIIGNALPNSLHWRDAKKLRDAGMRVIRNAHYPQDPAFMDACDELGLFVISNTPGWQFWNEKPIFEQRIYHDIRNMVRRDRNHASLFFWEPVLNETFYPKEFAHNAKKCIDEEYPYSGAGYSACDPVASGSELFPIIYSHPEGGNGYQGDSPDTLDPAKIYFTREFGDNVDDWFAHNSPSRVHRSWGEFPMLQQAQHYANPPYQYTCIETLYRSPRQHIGGALWHSFDHQRGYHPQAFYGGIMDVYRQPKMSYYMFMSQRPNTTQENMLAETGPMIYIAHQMTPFSPSDVVVYSNCDEVHLTIFENGEKRIYKRSSSPLKMPSPIITFENAFDIMEVKALARQRKHKEAYLLAEGFIDGKLVVTDKRVPAFRPTNIRLCLDNEGQDFVADGGDILTVIAEVTDEHGTIKRLNNMMVKLTVEGEAELLEGVENELNPRLSQWGTAPFLIKSTGREGEIRVKAEIIGEGFHAVQPTELVFRSVAPHQKNIYDEAEITRKTKANQLQTKKVDTRIVEEMQNEIRNLRKELSNKNLDEVREQQDAFGEQR